jgi:hypothetical protein
MSIDAMSVSRKSLERARQIVVLIQRMDGSPSIEHLVGYEIDGYVKHAENVGFQKGYEEGISQREDYKGS